jgi:hypothetical protein
MFVTNETYWNDQGKYQPEYHALQRAGVVPVVGEAPTTYGERLRVAERVYHDLYNNGGGNIYEGWQYAEKRGYDDSFAHAYMRREGSRARFLRNWLQNYDEDEGYMTSMLTPIGQAFWEQLEAATDTVVQEVYAAWVQAGKPEVDTTVLVDGVPTPWR